MIFAELKNETLLHVLLVLVIVVFAKCYLDKLEKDKRDQEVANAKLNEDLKSLNFQLGYVQHKLNVAEIMLRKKEAQDQKRSEKF